MADVKRYVTAGGTFACILAIGFFMQNGANAPAQDGEMLVNGMGMADANGATGAGPAEVIEVPVEIADVTLTAAEDDTGLAATGTEAPAIAPAQAADMTQSADPVEDMQVSEVDANAMPDAGDADEAAPMDTAETMPIPQPAVAAEPEDDMAPMTLASTAASTGPAQDPMPAKADGMAATASTTGAQADEQPVNLVLLDPAPGKDAAAPMRAEPSMDAQCEITMTAAPMAAALVKLNLNAPCLPNERLTMHHDGMMFTDTTDAAGTLEVVVPALSEAAVFIASFANNEGAVANASVPELADFDRAVVQSEFNNSVGLHALEFGADYDQAGHIWANAAGNVADAAVGKGGFLTMLGNPAVSDALTAQVYSYPSAFTELSGDVTMRVEIEVTAENCGKDIEAQAMQTVRQGAPKVQTLELSMPDCDAVGDFLVLKNLVNDLKVAAIN